MKKLTVLAHGNDADAIVRKLMDLKCVEIRRLPADEDGMSLAFSENDGQRRRSEERLAAIRAVLPVLSRYTSRKSTIGRRVHRVNRKRFVADGKADIAWQTVERTQETLAQIQALEAEEARSLALRQALLPWLDYDAPLSVEGSDTTLLQLGSCPYKGDFSPVEAHLCAAGAYVEPVSFGRDVCHFAITCHKADADAVGQALADVGFVRTTFPAETGNAQATDTALENRMGEIFNEKEKLTDRLIDLADQLDGVEILSDIEETTLEVCVQKQKLLRTSHCAVLDSFVPAVRAEEVVEALSAFSCACELADPAEGEEVPVLLHNNRFSTTFEWVIEMYSYPKYGTFDPTLIMSIFYFLIFGLMFADVGYGLLLTLACFGGVKLLNPKVGMRRMLYMFGYCGIACMLMGVLFGGWFGNLPTAVMNSFFPSFGGAAETTPVGSFFYNGLIFNPVDSSIAFLFVALGVGEIHLIAGMVLDMIRVWKEGHPVVALCSNVPYWVLFLGIDLMIPVAATSIIPGIVPTEAQAALFSTLSTVGLYVLFAGLALILLLKGVGKKSFVSWLVGGLGGLYSLISYASDLLSYSRILALGLVASVIAQVINMLTQLGATGPFGFVFMLIVMILGHGLNLAINLLGTFVHAARLQYIEFFGKFYEDGGEAFRPAVPAENYSEDTPNVPNVNQ